jgi:hypothetical protein
MVMHQPQRSLGHCGFSLIPSLQWTFDLAAYLLREVQQIAVLIIVQ